MTSAISTEPLPRQLVVRLASASFRVCLRVLPPPSRRLLMADLLAMFDALASRAARRGVGAVASVTLHSILDLLRQSRRERREPPAAWRGNNRPPRHRIDRMGNLLTDLRHAARSLLRSPVYTGVVIATLALGIGANTAIFGLVHGIVLQPLDLPEPERLVVLSATRQGEPNRGNTLAYLNFIDVRDRAESFGAAAAYDEWRANLTGDSLGHDGEPERLDAAQVNVEFFDVLGLRPAAGRFFLAEEDVDGQDRVVVLSHGFWTRRFGRDPAVVGSTLTLNGNPHTVVGVAPADFEDPGLSGRAWGEVELWRPLGYHGLPVEDQPSRGSSSYTAIARLRDGVSIEAANEELASLSAALQEEYPENNAGVGMAARPLRDVKLGATATSLWLLLAAVALVLTIGLVNVIGLMTSRATGRRREVALRLALGAGRARLLQMYLCEGLMLASVGGGAALLLAHWLSRGFVSLAAGALPRAASPTLHTDVIGFTLLASLACGVVCGVATLVSSRRTDLQSALRAGSTGDTDRKGDLGARALVVTEVALAVVLLVGAALLLRTFAALNGVDMGLQTERVLAFDLSLPSGTYGEAAAPIVFYRDLSERLRATPGVEAVGAVNILPLSGNYDCNGTFAADQPEPGPNEYPCPEVRTVTPGYLDAMQLELMRGRWFNDTDTVDTEWVTVLNEAFARQLWGDEDPLGRSVIMYHGKPITVVGVVRGVKHLSLDEEPAIAAYLSHRQAIMPWHLRRATLVVRTQQDPLAFVEAARATVRDMDPLLPVADVRTMDNVVASTVSTQRFRAVLIGAFGLMALLLAALGVYGVVSQSVTRRLREVAVRMALGADATRVLGLVLYGGLLPVLAGLAIGLVAAAAGGRAIRSLLFEVQPLDPVAFVAAAAILLAVAVTACWLPARRATRVDPMRTLREE